LYTLVIFKNIFITKNFHPRYTLAGFDLTAHGSAGEDGTTRPRRQGPC
jgi:hypothetical protein